MASITSISCAHLTDHPPLINKEDASGLYFLAVILSSLGVAQFLAKFVVDGRSLINFYGVIPTFSL